MRALLLSFVFVFAAAPAFSQTIAITNGKVYPVSGPPVSNATVLIRDGLIVAVGAQVSVPAGAQTIDATGKIVTPGLINSITELGVIEIDLVRNTSDVSAKGNNNIAASFRVWDGLNPASALFAPARNEGVTTAIVVPQGGLVSGQAAAIDLVTGQRTDMIRRPAVAMVAQVDNTNNAGTSARGELIGKLRTLLEDVTSYLNHRNDYERAALRTLSASRADLEALDPVIQGKMLLLIEANRVDEIDAAIALAREYHLKIAIAGGAEAWLCADRLAAARVPVLTGAMDNIPESFATLNQRQENAALLRKAGVQVV
ncbi:MAG TPA: hypothetical protein VKD91_07395, partial [Pyrinomonadaceae bacterium]|nr:hypothetical protein [Pyrinomonadaceae bacterium]